MAEDGASSSCSRRTRTKKRKERGLKVEIKERRMSSPDLVLVILPIRIMLLKIVIAEFEIYQFLTVQKKILDKHYICVVVCGLLQSRFPPLFQLSDTVASPELNNDQIGPFWDKNQLF